MNWLGAAANRLRPSPLPRDMSWRAVRGPDAVDRLGEDFDVLLRDTDAPVTAQRTWLSCWARHHTEYEPVLITVYRGGVLSAVAPLALRNVHGVHEVVALGHGESDYTRLPARTPVDAQWLARGLAHMLRTLPGAWSLHLEQLPTDDPALHALRRRLRPSVVEPGDPAPFAPSSPDHPPVVRPNARRAARKGRNRIERDGRHLDVGRHRDEAAVRTLLPEIAALRAAREEALGRLSLPDEAGRAFWFHVIPALAQESSLEIITLRIDGTLGAYGVALLDGSAYRVWDARVSPCFLRYELGHLYRDAALESVVADGSTELDWMRGAEEYKMASATDLRLTSQLWSSSWRPSTTGAIARAAWRTRRTAHPWLARAESVLRPRAAALRRWTSGRPRTT